MARRPTPLRDRLLAKVEMTASGCWIFTGRLNNHGYGRLWAGPGGTADYAHRLAYLEFVGPIPDGLELDHLCRVRACCNPAHLQATTRRTNVLRSASPVAINAIKTACPKGHAYDDINTYVSPDGRHRRCRKCNTDLQRASRRAA